MRQAPRLRQLRLLVLLVQEGGGVSALTQQVEPQARLMWQARAPELLVWAPELQALLVQEYPLFQQAFQAVVGAQVGGAEPA